MLIAGCFLGKSIVTIVAGTGPGDAPQKMVKFVESLSVKNVFLVGPQSQRRLAELYSIADVGVFPSFQEPQVHDAGKART